MPGTDLEREGSIYKEAILSLTEALYLFMTITTESKSVKSDATENE